MTFPELDPIFKNKFKIKFEIQYVENNQISKDYKNGGRGRGGVENERML